MRKLLAVLIGIAIMAACGDSTGPSETNISGTYELQTINGQNLPFTLLIVGTYQLEIAAGSVTINANGTYEESTTVREIDGSSTTTTTETSSGTWTRTNNAVTFVDGEDQTSLTGALSGSTLTFSEEGSTLVYQR